ncbi:hypothetical protein ACIGXM_14125 [Kitasatospora sp. NPDC052896]|uniref:hypothetical protein n=1 Tax=Kitasatospora sp. NPDC052896 TaxID=3364061 RepID=UPI0037CC2C22
MARGGIKPGPGLAAYLEATKSADILFGAVQKHILVKATRPDGRRQDVLHPSEMIKPDWCHRAAFYKLLNPPPKGPTTFVRENVFQEGHNTHAKWQKWLQEMKRLGGDWYCESCRQTFWDDETPELCQLCSSPLLTYAEVPLNAPALTIGGKSDGYCPEDNCLIEIKTLGLGSIRFEDPKFLAKYELEMEGRGQVVDLVRMWRDFRRPLPQALRQGQLYLYLARHFEDLWVDRITYFYEFKPTQEAKSFTVLYDESISEPAIEGAQLITDALAAGRPPRCNINPGGSCKNCRALDTAGAA